MRNDDNGRVGYGAGSSNMTDWLTAFIHGAIQLGGYHTCPSTMHVTAVDHAADIICKLVDVAERASSFSLQLCRSRRPRVASDLRISEGRVSIFRVVRRAILGSLAVEASLFKYPIANPVGSAPQSRLDTLPNTTPSPAVDTCVDRHVCRHV